MLRFVIGSRKSCCGTLAGLVLFMGISMAAPATLRAQGGDAYRAGLRAEEQKDYDQAFEQFQRASQADPSNVQYMMAFKRVRFQAGAMHVARGHDLRAQGNLAEALAQYERAAMMDPSSPVAFQSIEQTRALLAPSAAAPDQGGVPAVEEALGPPELQPLSRDPINLRATNESRIIFETIGRLAGVNVLFDMDFMTRRITVDLSNVTLEEALDQVAVMTRTFWKPLTRNSLLVLPDTTVKRREQEQQILKTFYLSNTITPQELTEVVTAIRSLLETRRIQQVNSMNAIIIRDTPDKVAIAEKIIRDVDKAKPEVVVDVAVLEVRRDRARQIGLFPTSGGAPGISTAVTPNVGGAAATTTPGTGLAAATPAATGNQINLSRVGSLSSGDFSITLPGAQFSALLSDSNTRILQRPEIRASDAQRATLRIGERVPIATGAIQPGLAGQAIGFAQTQFQYIDVGVNLDITPKMHSNNEITLAVRVEVSAVTNEKDIGGIVQPIIGQRIIEHNIRLREGEINILGGLFQRQNVERLSGIPGLSQIPFLRYFFSNINTTVAEDEVLIVLQPHAVRRQDLTALNRRALDIGTEGDVRLRTPRELPAPANGETPAEPPAAPAAPGPGAALRFPGETPAAKAGETFEVPVQIENAADAFSVALEVAYDPRAVKLVRIAKGGFLGSDGQLVAVVERTEEESGTTAVTLSRPPGSGSVSGSGELAVLTFQALQPGPTALGVMPAGIQTPARELRPLQGAQAVLTIQSRQ